MSLNITMNIIVESKWRGMIMKKRIRRDNYENISNIRITYVPRSNRPKTKDWAGTDVLRFQAYKDSKRRSLFIGPEMSIQNSKTILELIEALCRIYRIIKK
jgi:hypothetical protein